jgi:transposase
MAIFHGTSWGCFIMAMVSTSSLFAELDRNATSEPAAAPAPAIPEKRAPRLRSVERLQISMHCESLDQRLPAQHLARDIWSFVEGSDLSPLYDSILAVEGGVGRDATDPKILMAVWLYAIAQGQGSARAVARFCDSGDHAYAWLCGGVSLNYHMLSDFRVNHAEVLDNLFTQSLAALVKEGLVDLTCTAQDGMRVRASAGKSSFRRQETLEKCLEEAEAHVAKLKLEMEQDSAGQTRREKAAQERAARERVERVQAALKNAEELASQKESRKKGSGEGARASTTDPESRNMKMPDGGFRPAYNVQFATTTESGVIVGVDVTNQGTDAGLMEPMLEQIEERTEQRPDSHLTDGGYSVLADIEKAGAGGTTVYTPVKDEEKKTTAGQDPFAPQPKDSPEVAEWRQRMGTEAGKAKYKLRAQTAELTNAHARNRGFYGVCVRGLKKVRTVATWYALVHNVVTGLRLRAQRIVAAATAGGPTVVTA